MSLIVKLNGNNYVSAKTKGAFAQALVDGQKQQAARNKRQEGRKKKQEAGKISHTQSGSCQQPAASNLQLLNSLDHALDHSYEHQTLTMRVHEQYLNNQSDYTGIFSQLMQQQGMIFADGVANAATSPQQAESAALVLTTLAHSMTRFHDLQEQTLDVHKQFLAQQSEYARATIQLLKEQHGNGNGNGHYPAIESKVESRKSKVGESANQRISEEASQRLSVSASQRRGASVDSPSPISDLQSPISDLLTPALLAIVSDKTGYPADMLELDMDMEADLGIDSIKRVEILGALQETHPELPEVETDVLAELRTLAQIVDYMSGEASQRLSVSAFEQPVSSTEQAKKV